MKKKSIILLVVVLSLMVTFVGCGVEIDGPEVNVNETSSDDFGSSTDEDIDYTTAVGLPNFNTPDIYGDIITNDIFKDYKLTMVNVWGTFCGPCIKEMPSLGEIQNEYQDKGINIIGILVDVQDSDLKIIEKQLEIAKDIAEATGADYTHLTVTSELITAKIGEIDAIPATFFVDSDGRFVGETYVGSRDMEEWIGIIEKTLEEI